jgi:hypothetical protein
MEGRSAETWLEEVRGGRPRPNCGGNTIHAQSVRLKRRADYCGQLGVKKVVKAMQ